MNAHSTTPRQLTVGIVTYDFDPPIGGLGALAGTYIRELRRQFPQHRFVVISPSLCADDRGSWFGRLRWRRSGGCPLFSLSLSWSLAGRIRKHAIDVLHIHTGSGGVFLLRRPSCPVVVTAHHTYRQEAAIVFIRSSLKRIWKKWMSFLERRTYRIADAVTCVSSDTAQELIQNYGIDAKKISIVENPVPFEPLEKYRGLPKQNRTILFVGRLEERKGVMLLLEAFDLLLKDMPDIRLRLVGSNLLGEKLGRFIRTHKLEEKVTLLGYVHDPIRFREMAQATVLVVPSKLEGFGLVAAEGMLLGTCVVASDAPGLRSIVGEGKTGFVFRNDDELDLVRALRTALTNDGQRSAVETSARAIAETRFRVEDRARELMELLTRITR